MKAWHCATDFDDFYGGHILVWAGSKGAARRQWQKACWYEAEFTEIKVRRAKEWDGIRIVSSHLEANDHLPEGVKPFYSEVEW